MGRVRSYKKIKACDPFSKKGKREVDLVHDEPPDVFEERVRRDMKRKERSWDDENERELRLQREAKRMLAIDESKKKMAEKKIEGKREEESMKEFKMRIRQETRVALRDELKGMTATSKKRKERLKERKLKRKGLTGKVSVEDEEEEGFSSSKDGRLRPSDLGGAEDFAKPEAQRFGERVDRPPMLKKSKLLEKKKEAASRAGPASSSSSSSSVSSRQEMQELKEKAEAAYRALREKRKQLHIF